MENTKKMSKVPSPLVDLSTVLEANCSESNLEITGKCIIEGFKQKGYIYLKNHGLTVKDIKVLTEATDQFFYLKDDVKMKYKRRPGIFHGYSTEKDESIDKDIESKRTASRHHFNFLSLDGLFPDEEVPQLRPAVANILHKLIPTVIEILKCLELGLGMERGTLVDAHKLMNKKGNLTNLRSFLYMPPKGEEQDNRLSPHFDFSTVTLQIYGDLGGLELLDKQGNWQQSELYPGYILLFPSQAIERWTGNIIPALKHRVTIPKDEVSRRKDRHAVILFVEPDNEAIIKPFNGSTAYEPMTGINFYNHYAKMYFPNLFDGKT